MKKLPAFVLTLSLLLGCLTLGAAASGGEPVLSDWAVDSYAKANGYGILNSFCRGGDFTGPITRAEFCDMVFNALRLIKSGMEAEIDVLQPGKFSDCDRYSVYCLAQLGIVNGVGEGLFAPDEALTREQAAAILQRAGKTAGFTFLPVEKDDFSDLGDASKWARGAACEMRASGVMLGTGENKFRPGEPITREQAAAAAVRFLEKNGYNDGIFIENADGVLTLDDFEGLNGKYRATGENSYEVTYFQGDFLKIEVSVSGERIAGAVLTYLDSGKELDLMKANQRDVGPLPATRQRLGDGVYVTENDGKMTLVLHGSAALTLPGGEYGAVGYQKMGGGYAAYAYRGGETVFFSLADGRELFAVNGLVCRITNRYIITEETRYPGETVDGAYSVYGVYSLAGEKIQDMGLTGDELYRMGYVQDL